MRCLIVDISLLILDWRRYNFDPTVKLHHSVCVVGTDFKQGELVEVRLFEVSGFLLDALDSFDCRSENAFLNFQAC